MTPGRLEDKKKALDKRIRLRNSPAQNTAVRSSHRHGIFDLVHVVDKSLVAMPNIVVVLARE